MKNTILTSTAAIVEVDSLFYFRLSIDNGTLSYSKQINDSNELHNAIINAIHIVESVPEYLDYVKELKPLV